MRCYVWGHCRLLLAVQPEVTDINWNTEILTAWLTGNYATTLLKQVEMPVHIPSGLIWIPLLAKLHCFTIVSFCQSQAGPSPSKQQCCDSLGLLCGFRAAPEMLAPLWSAGFYSPWIFNSSHCRWSKHLIQSFHLEDRTVSCPAWVSCGVSQCPPGRSLHTMSVATGAEWVLGDTVWELAQSQAGLIRWCN